MPAVDMFMKIGDIKGESVDSKHKDEIHIESFSWGMSQAGSGGSGSGGGTGKVSVQDLSFTHYLDKASPNLALYCCTGKHYDQALLTVRKAGDKPVEHYKLTMKDVLISSVSPGGTSADGQILETVSLNFSEFKIEYTPQKKDGSADSTIEAGFNVAQNVKV